MDNIIKLEINLRNLGSEIKHAMALHHKEIEEYVQTELERQIKTFDYKEVEKKAYSKVLSKSLEEYLAYGEGHKFIEKSIREGLKDIFKEEKI